MANKRTEEIRITPRGAGTLVAGSPRKAGDLVHVEEATAAQLVKDGNADWSFRVKVGPRGILAGDRHHAGGSVVSVPRSRAAEMHRTGAGEVLEPSRFRAEELARPENGQDSDPWRGFDMVRVR